MITGAQHLFRKNLFCWNVWTQTCKAQNSDVPYLQKAIQAIREKIACNEKTKVFKTCTKLRTTDFVKRYSLWNRKPKKWCSKQNSKISPCTSSARDFRPKRSEQQKTKPTKVCFITSIDSKTPTFMSRSWAMEITTVYIWWSNTRRTRQELSIWLNVASTLLTQIVWLVKSKLRNKCVLTLVFFDDGRMFANRNPLQCEPQPKFSVSSSNWGGWRVWKTFNSS